MAQLARGAFPSMRLPASIRALAIHGSLAASRASCLLSIDVAGEFIVRNKSKKKIMLEAQAEHHDDV